MTYNPLTRELLDSIDWVEGLGRLSLLSEVITELASDEVTPKQVEKIRVISEYLRADIENYSDSLRACFKRALKLSKKIEGIESNSN